LTNKNFSKKVTILEVLKLFLSAETIQINFELQRRYVGGDETFFSSFFPERKFSYSAHVSDGGSVLGPHEARKVSEALPGLRRSAAASDGRF
jgi:hypothetical protein